MTETLVEVRFADVGPQKKTWTSKIKVHADGGLDEEQMYQAVRKSRALASRGIDFGDDGQILVGMFRCVGRWEILP